MNDNSESRNDDPSELRSSTVMPAAHRHPSFEVLVDDLFIRLRCSPPNPTQVARIYPLYGLGEEPQLRALFREAKVWWLTNELAELDAEARRWLICEVFQRSASEAALLALAIFGAIPFPELRLEDIEAMQSWFDTLPTLPRNIRDALVLKVWLPWFNEHPERTEEKIRDWLSCAPSLVRAALVLCVGLEHECPSNDSTTIVLQLLANLAGQRDREVGSAIGWFLSTLWHRNPRGVEDWLSAHAGNLSRRVFRIAVGRMPTPVRVELIDLWKASK